MSQSAAGGGRRIIWPSLITIVSAAILIGAEVFGAAYVGSWAIGTLLGFGLIGQRLLDATLFGCGLYVMYMFIRAAQTAEPFTKPR